MGFQTEKIPYNLNFGIDFSLYEIEFTEQILSNLVYNLKNYQIDYLITNVSVEDRILRNESIKKFEIPIFIDDYSLMSYQWKNKFIGKIHDEDVDNLQDSVELIQMDLNYCNHLSTKYIVIKMCTNSDYRFTFVKLLRKYFTDNPDKLVGIIVPFTSEGLIEWNKLQSQLGGLDNLGMILEIQADLPDKDILMQCVSHNLKSIYIPLSIFITNKNGYPVLSKLHQDYIKFLFRYKIDVIFVDDCQILIDDENNFPKIKDYYLYLCHLFINHQEFKNIDYLLFNYLDIFQTPLQPLRDNLQSQTYECFEEDNVKYDYYEKAIDLALINYKSRGYLNDVGKKDMVGAGEIEVDAKVEVEVEVEVEAEKNVISIPQRILTACVLGAGRGPLARKVISAAIKNGFKIGENFNVILVEKNRNAFNTLLNLKLHEPEIFSAVTMVFSDMREFKPNCKIDIVVSELLGSFGDNELSPECLIPIQDYLSDDSIMIPHSYTSYIRPVTCPVIWSEIKRLKDNYQSAYVILLHKAYYPISEVSECFTFTHPVRENMNRMKKIKFKFPQNAVIHGFVGYFQTKLYDSVELSIVPYNHTSDLFSWFPIYFPTTTPIEIFKDGILEIEIARENDSKKVWYEWRFDTSSSVETNKSHSIIHNLGGVFSSIML